MKLIFKSMVSLLVLANLAGAASKDEAAESSSARPVFALPAPGFDEMFRDIALNAGRVRQEVSVLALAAPTDTVLDGLMARLLKVQSKLEQRQAEWEALKGTIQGLTVEMTSSSEGELAALTTRLQKMELAPEKMINSLEGFITTTESHFKDAVLGTSDTVSRTRSNISGLTEILAELEAELKAYKK